VRRAAWISIGCAIAAAAFWLYSYLQNWTGSNWLDAVTTLVPVPITFALGLTTRRLVGVAACAGLTVIGELGGSFNPFVIVITFGPWLAGAVIRERQRVARRLEEVGRLLETESRLLAEEAVRLERTRIARELHDIVAHCVSVMVVQAYAGDKLMATDHNAASEAFEHIASAADQAQTEIAHLVTLLDGGSRSPHQGDLATSLQDLAASAAATGLDVSLSVTGRPADLSANAAAVAFRIVQEGVTNSLKHSPGAPIVISVDCETEVTVDVLNGTGQEPSALSAAGGGHGLSGIKERVTGLGGSFAAGPQPPGAWRVSVRFPAA
jgi:signal transduction histidine kinase